jgi:hypothetical protein
MKTISTIHCKNPMVKKIKATWQALLAVESTVNLGKNTQWIETSRRPTRHWHIVMRSIVEMKSGGGRRGNLTLLIIIN